MSNGKVRIYDLAKELNRDNKDLLTICEKLAISVKSHSSTISDEEAAQIRQEAETFTPPVAPKPMRPAQAPARPKPSVPMPVKKSQQIVAVHSTHSRPTPALAPTSEGNSTPGLVEQPSRPVPQLHRPPAREGSLQPPIKPIVRAPQPPAPPAPATPEVEPLVQAQEPAPLPTLQGPPPRPRSTPSAAETAASASSLEGIAPPRKVRLPDPPRSQQLQHPEPLKVPGPKISVSGSEPVPPDVLPKPVHKLQPPPRLLDAPVRPAPPKPPGTGTSEDAIEVLQNDSVNRVLSTRGRRTRGKTAQEEEEELRAKNAAKGKRRTSGIEEEDELDFGADSLLKLQTIDVSQSLVRPPKPKATKSSRPVTVKPEAKPAPKKADKNDRRGHRGRDRQEEEEVTRPEKITLDGSLTVQELAMKLVVPESEVIKVLFFKGIAATINQALDLETAEMVTKELGIEVEAGTQESAAKKVTEMIEAGDLDYLQRRPPVVTIMGHVDHGKTSLLDAIRHAKVAQGEAGGITQHIGAYHVDVEHNGEPAQVVFLDTPGHEAFTAMRARGARVTDVAVLVVAADDGVQPQTIEAISHAKAAGVPIVVAINKIDKESAQPDRVKQELTEFNLVPEEWGGDTIMVPVSALQRENLDTLLEMILLVSEVEDLYANPDRPARGTVIEAHLDKARGAVATFLVQNGTLRVGDVFVAGACLGKVRAMIDDRGQRVEAAGPSFAVEVLGLTDVPAAGDEFEVFIDEKAARSLADQRTMEQRQVRLAQAMAARRVSLTTLSDQAREGELKELNLVLKADVQGSLEAILASLGQLPQDQVQLRILLSAPGEITETDVDLAAASSAVIVGFNTTLASGARQAADQNNVDIREYNIIYKLLDDLQAAMEGLLDPEMVEEELGQAEVRATFAVAKGVVAGCYVQAGKLVRNCKIRVQRGNQTVHSGVLTSLKRMKDDAKEVATGFECGVRLDDFQGWQEGDVIAAYQTVAKRRTL
ncbi:translation initiation factor IF-2 [Synechococcus sp. PCC 6312]|uniref:translation initiation factor IF-2 n=1 Tax=Synechococcus sp. (strain ATCC 27167 / PCC 6312) TaxID=195253 RepID=UPI00029ED7B9|nr:translation initiation factor IF-2 [Synechococcus sp. PCC 6312]AFY61332.1 bacterial translation initiation factor 2 (bIF-2) [Synechococcus sp. PCC 6312]